MNPPAQNLFPQITDAHWRAMFARHRAERAQPTAIEAQIRAVANAPSKS
jgi:hypothetical protein